MYANCIYVNTYFIAGRSSVNVKHGEAWHSRQIVKGHRVSLVEHSKQGEDDPLMDYGGLDADGELSDQSEDPHSSRVLTNGAEQEETSVNNRTSVVDFDPYSPNSVQCRPNRQPLMGVNVSTLSHGSGQLIF